MEELDKMKSLLSKLDFLDRKIGITYCGDSEEFYLEMLHAYLDSGKYEEICDAYEKGAWNNYRISVHALKSTSLAIGATEVSEQAKALEQAAKEDDIAYIRLHHQSAMEGYFRLLKKIETVLGEGSEDTAQIEIEQTSYEKNILEEESVPHILIVDDDAMNLQVAERMLKEGFRTTGIKSGKEVIAFLEEQHTDLILLDLHMPEMNGFEVIAQLKANPEYQDIPVIFLTADNDKEAEIQGFYAGALDFITKPFVKEIMIQRVSRILELDKLQKHLQREVERQTRTAEERKRKVERLSIQIIHTLASTVDAKDKYTNGHSMRVAKYSSAIAERMGKSSQEQENIYYMGLLHDIGKIGIPDEIINKPTRLTDEEFAIIKKHPIIGAEILKNVSEIPGLGLGTRGHHEQYDGHGYPDGLKGGEIPLEARIIAVADSYDAMASKRSYRDVLPQCVVRGEIEKGRGTQFDPEIADIMLELIDEDTEYQMHE